MKKYFDEALMLDERIDALIGEMTIEEKVSQLTNSAAGIDRLGIKKYDWWNEALHGVARAGTATVFPQAIGLAATWNTELLNKVADAISTEARAKYNAAQSIGNFNRYYGLTFWSPNINIFRDPRWGRGHETYGEDPYLTAQLGKAFITGLQGNTKHLKAAACAKHFAVHSGPESTRRNFNSEVSKKDLYETYLPAFEACVKEAKVEAVMGAYNAVNGVPCCCNRELLINILRDKWGFKGHVVSDCGAIHNIAEYHKYTDSFTDAAAVSIKNGCDLNCGNVYESLTDAYEEDKIAESDLDNALRHTLRARFKLGMFDKKTEYDDIGMDVVACEKHKKLCLEATRQSLVLLKNDGILPLNKEKINTLAVIGPNADSKEVLLGNYNGLPTDYSTVYSGFCDYLGKSKVRYARGCNFFGGCYEDFILNGVSLARECDAAVLCLGLSPDFEGEEGGVNTYASGDREKIELTQSQQRLLKEVCRVQKNVIVVLMSGGAVASQFADENAGAVINAWYPGELGGKALAELIFGEYSPSGKLPVTFYKSTDDLPDISDYSMKNRTYRYYNGEVLYPFGHGLSYTSFKTETIKENDFSYSFKIDNTGSFDSYYTAELYTAEIGGINQPIKQLRRFEKIFVKSGESETVKFMLTNDDFSHINDNGEKECLSPQSFTVEII